MVDKVIRIKIEAGDSKAQIDSLDKSMVGLGASADKTNAEIAGLNTDLTKTAQGVKVAVGATNEAIGNLGRTTGQAAMQVQQLVGQVQGGVSPFVALSQQAADLGFVLGFPLLGAVVGIGAALAGPLVAAFTQAEESADKFKETLKGIVDTQEELKANKAVAEINALNREFDKQQETITNLTRQQAQYIELIQKGGSAQASYASALFNIDRQLESAREKQKGLADQIEQVTNASLSNTATTAEQDDTLQRLTTTLEVQRIALEQGELQARLFAAAQALKLETTKELPAAIRDEVTAIYQLEEAQKAAKESAAALNREINSEAESDKQQAARAIRDQQRIDQRIANMRLETATLSSETVLQQAVLDERFSFEEAQLAAQTASRIMAATTEYDQLQALAGDDYARKLEAEIAFKEQIAAINEQYALGQDELDYRRLAMAEDTTQRIRDANVSAFSSGVSIMETFLGRSNGIVKAARLAMGAYQAFSIYASSQAAAAAALAPPPIGLGPIAGAPLAGALALSGKLSAAAVLAGAASSVFSGSGGGGGGYSGGGGAASTPTLPTTPQSAAQVGSFEIVGLSALQEQLDRLDNDEVLPVSFTKRLVASLESVQRLQGA